MQYLKKIMVITFYNSVPVICIQWNITLHSYSEHIRWLNFYSSASEYHSSPVTNMQQMHNSGSQVQFPIQKISHKPRCVARELIPCRPFSW